MTGWIVAAILYGLGAVFVFKAANDAPLLRAIIWPFLVIFLLFTA